MATVYLGLCRGPGGFYKLQVLKRLRSTLAEDPEFVAMFLDEARLAARINHPNVVQTNEVGSDGPHHYIAMEYLEGQSLEAIVRAGVKKNRPLPLPYHLKILSYALEGLHHAHELTDLDGTPLSIVHRDVSPQNVMVTYDGHVKMLDFGIAKASDSSQETRPGLLKGKCAYMAPEQFSNVREDRRADIFAMGIMLWQALAGRRIWEGLSDTQILVCLAKGEIPSLREANPKVPEKLERLCMKALASSRDDRFETAAELQAGIEDHLAEHGERVSPAQIGAFVASLFAERRASVRLLIEAQLKQGNEMLDPPPSAPSLGSHTLSNNLEVGVPPPPPSKPRRRVLLFAAVGSVALVLAGVAAVKMLHGTPAATAGTPASSSAAPPAAVGERPAAGTQTAALGQAASPAHTATVEPTASNAPEAGSKPAAPIAGRGPGVAGGPRAAAPPAPSSAVPPPPTAQTATVAPASAPTPKKPDLGY